MLVIPVSPLEVFDAAKRLLQPVIAALLLIVSGCEQSSLLSASSAGHGGVTELSVAGSVLSSTTSVDPETSRGTEDGTAQRIAVTDHDWPQWRGPWGTGVAPESDPPIEWSETKNVRWKVPLPGRGHSTPIVLGDRIFLTTAIPYGEELPPRFSTAPGTHDGVPVTQHHEFVVLALDRRDGAIVWQTTVHKKLPHEGGHYSASLA